MKLFPVQLSLNHSLVEWNATLFLLDASFLFCHFIDFPLFVVSLRPSQL